MDGRRNNNNNYNDRPRDNNRRDPHRRQEEVGFGDNSSSSYNQNHHNNNNNNNSYSSYSRGRSGGITCYNCGETGHRKDSCSKPLRRRVCYNCNQQGHYKEQCPQLYQPVLSIQAPTVYDQHAPTTPTPTPTPANNTTSTTPNNTYIVATAAPSTNSPNPTSNTTSPHNDSSNFTPPSSFALTSIPVTSSQMPALVPTPLVSPASTIPNVTPPPILTSSPVLPRPSHEFTSPPSPNLRPDEYSHLPISKYKHDILSAISANQVVVISGATGSGKTTQVPKYLLEQARQRNEKISLVCTQPRRLAATSIARRKVREVVHFHKRKDKWLSREFDFKSREFDLNRTNDGAASSTEESRSLNPQKIFVSLKVADELHESVGKTVGFQIGMDKVASASTSLLFVTTGVLLQRLIHNKSLGGFTHVILDEVHERDLDTDFSLVIIKELLPRHPNVRLILMSATFNCDLFSGYFPLVEVAVANHEVYRYKLAPSEGYSNNEENNNNNPRGKKRERSPEKNNNTRHSPVSRSSFSLNILSVEGRCYPVKVNHLEDVISFLKTRRLSPPYPNVSECAEQDLAQPALEQPIMILAAQLVMHLDSIITGDEHDNGNKEDNAVLVFLPGYGEIQELYEIFQQFDTSSLWLLPLHSTITADEQARVFQKATPGVRKVILSTNIAESSVTVPDIRYVIDFGFVKEIYFDPQTNLQSLKLQFISKASAVQRQGRAGRVAPGVVFRLYKQEFYHNSMTEYSTSEMLRCPLESLVLQVKVMEEPLELLNRSIQPPNTDSLDSALSNLRDAGGLDKRDRLTFLGRLFSALPVDINISRLLLLGHIFGVLDEAIVMAASISLRSIFARPFQHPLQAFTKKLEWSGGSESDCISSLYAYETLQNNRSNRVNSRGEREWCRRNFIHYNTLSEMEDVIKELHNRLSFLGIRPSRRDFVVQNREVLLKVIIFGAFYPKYFLGKLEKRDIDNATTNSWYKEQCNPYRTVQLYNVPSGATPAKIQEIMEQCGTVSKVSVHSSKAFVEFDASSYKESIVKACKIGGMKRLLYDGQSNDHGHYHDRTNYSNQNRTHNSVAFPSVTGNENEGWDDTYAVEMQTPTIVHPWQSFQFKVLGGPSHPFKLGFVTLENTEPVFVEGTSVNYAVLDHSIEVPNSNDRSDYSSNAPSPISDRFLVAAFISNSGGNQNRQMLRETTLMPPIPMIGELLYMTFCPEPAMAFWSNRRQTHLRGVSLDGYKIDLPFQRMVHKSDITLINELRRKISESLTSEGIKQDNSSVLFELLQALLNKQRKKVKVRHRAFDSREQYLADRHNDSKTDHHTIEHHKETLLLQPIRPVGQFLVDADENLDYDSEEEERKNKIKVIEDIRSRVNITNTDDEDKMVWRQLMRGFFTPTYAQH